MTSKELKKRQDSQTEVLGVSVNTTLNTDSGTFSGVACYNLFGLKFSTL